MTTKQKVERRPAGAIHETAPPLRNSLKIKKAGPMWSGLTMSRDMALIPVDRIGIDPDQPRRDFDQLSLNRLADSLKARGQLQPIGVRWVAERSQFVVVFGERRWKAATIAGLPALTCRIFERPMGPAELLVIQMVENCAREDLSPLDQARAMKALIELNGWSQATLAAELGVSTSTVSRSLAILEFPPIVRDAVIGGDLSPAVARELSRFDDPDVLADLVERAIREGWSRDQAASTARAALAPPVASASPNVAPCNEIAPIEVEESTPDGSTPNSFGYSAGIIPGSEIAQGEDDPADWPTFEVVESIGQKSPGHIQFRRVDLLAALAHASINWPGMHVRPVVPGGEIGAGKGSDGRPKTLPSPLPPVPSKALPDWRDRPAMGLGFSKRLMNLLANSKIECAGEAWAKVEAGAMVELHNWSYLDQKDLEHELLKLRAEAGDPANPFRPTVLPSLKVAAAGDVADDGPGSFDHFEVTRSVFKWEQNPFTPQKRLILATKGGISIVAIADAPRSIDEVHDLICEVHDLVQDAWVEEDE